VSPRSGQAAPRHGRARPGLEANFPQCAVVGGRERTQWGEDDVYAADAEFAGQISFNILEHVLPATAGRQGDRPSLGSARCTFLIPRMSETPLVATLVAQACGRLGTHAMASVSSITDLAMLASETGGGGGGGGGGAGCVSTARGDRCRAAPGSDNWMTNRLLDLPD
jgi:hypothetical protein